MASETTTYYTWKQITDELILMLLKKTNEIPMHWRNQMAIGYIGEMLHYFVKRKYGKEPFENLEQLTKIMDYMNREQW